MKAAVLRKVGKPLAIEDLPMPSVGAHEVLVETKSCGICRTDLHIVEGLAYTPNLPHIPGHEPAGIVSQVGEDVAGLEIGERVVPYLFATCGRCAYCRIGRDSLCTNLAGMLGVQSNGGFAQYFVAPAMNLFPLPDSVPFETGGLASCAVITAVHAFRRSRVRLGDAAVVIGAGGVAQPLIQLLKAAGIRVIAVSRSREKLDIALGLGADFVISSEAQDIANSIAEFTTGDGAACVYDCVGISSTMKESAAFVRRGGQIIVLGEEPEFPSINTIDIAQRELEIMGSRNGSREDFVDAIAMLASGIIVPPIARTFRLEEINEALQFVKDGRAHARVVVTL